MNACYQDIGRLDFLLTNVNCVLSRNSYYSVNYVLSRTFRVKMKEDQSKLVVSRCYVLTNNFYTNSIFILQNFTQEPDILIDILIKVSSLFLNFVIFNSYNVLRFKVRLEWKMHGQPKFWMDVTNVFAECSLPGSNERQSVAGRYANWGKGTCHYFL